MKIAGKTPSAPEVPATDVNLPLELIVSHPNLPNRTIDTGHVGELFDSIKRNGLDTRLDVWGGDKPDTKMKMGDKVHPASFLIAGAHRREALRKLYKEDPERFKTLFPNGVPCRIRVCSLSDALLLQLRENVMRSDATPEQIFPVLKHLVKLGLKQNVIARRIGKSDGWVSQMLDIESNLGEEGLEEVSKGGMTIRDARAASKEVAKAKKAGQAVNPKEAVNKLKEKLASKRKGKKRAEKRVSLKVLYNRFTTLPGSKMTVAKKLQILEAAVLYAIGESDEVPAELGDEEESEK